MIRVVWLCHFVNQEIKDYFNTPKAKETAPWMNDFINLFKEIKDIDLHIVAPNLYNNRNVKFRFQNISYHLYSYYPLIMPRKIYNLSRFDFYTNFNYIKNTVRSLINGIKPDIIHLFGAENPYYSVGIQNLLTKYPTLITIQGFISLSEDNNFYIKKRIEIEKAIIKNASNFGVCTNDMIQIIKKLNPNAVTYFHDYPMTNVNFRKDDSCSSNFDVVFFARITKTKGIEDLLQAIKIVKNIKQDISLHVIGKCSNSYLHYLKELSQQLSISENVRFLGFLPTQNDVYQTAIKAKVCVLPTYRDVLPGTILESMLMKLPVIAYSVGGIPELNVNQEVVVLVEKNNITQLANKIIELLYNENKRILIADNAFKFVTERFKNEKLVTDIINAYKNIIASSNR